MNSTASASDPIDQFIQAARLKSDQCAPQSILRFHQLNLHKSITPTTNLVQSMQSESASIALVQEPHLNPKSGVIKSLGSSFNAYAAGGKPRTGIFYHSSITPNLLPLKHFTNRDLATSLLLNPGSALPKIIISSFYWSHDEITIPSSLIDLMNHSRAHQIPVILSMDANAHNTLWGSTDTNNRGIIMASFLAMYNLHTLNNSTQPTFQTKTQAQVLDITCVSESLLDSISNWKVNSSPSLSDHASLSFELHFMHTVAKSFRKIKNTNWTQFSSLLAEKQKTLDSIMQSPTIDNKVDLLQSTLKEVWETSCHLIHVSKRSSIPWWNSELSKEKSNLRRLYRRANRRKAPHLWTRYKFSLNEYTKHIQHAKKESWENFTSGFDSHHLAKISKLISKSKQMIPSLAKDDGTFTESHIDTLECILAKVISCEDGTPPSTSSASPRTTSSNHLSASIINEEVLDKIIKGLKDFKSPGPDGLYGIMIKKSWDYIKVGLMDILKTSLDDNVIPSQWTLSSAVLIPKSSKPSPKAFRVINLSPILLKVLEKCILIFLKEKIKIKHSKNQFGFKRGSSTEKALYKVTSKIHNSLKNKKLMIGVFLDLSAAFDNINFDSIDKALLHAGSPDSINKWISKFIRNRFVNFHLGTASVIKRILKGSPQGGILSPFLFNLVVDILLHKLEELSPDSLTAFADDLCNLISGLNITEAHSKTQDCMNVIHHWCEHNGLKINTTKSCVILFTRKRNLFLPPIFIGGDSIPIVQKTKYLGVNLDSKLSFLSHIKSLKAKCFNKVSNLQRFTGKKWGIRPTISKWSYTSITRPALLYGSFIWGESLKKKSYSNIMNKAEGLALRTVTRSLKSTPLYSLYPMIDSPIQFKATESALLTLYRLASSDDFERSATVQHLYNFIEDHNFPLPGSIDLCPSVSNFHKNYSVYINHDIASSFNEPVFYEDTPKNWINVFTDGSKSSAHVGASYILYAYGQQHICKIHLELHNSIYQAEASAILQALSFISTNIHPDSSMIINFFTDSQSVLKSLDKHSLATSTIKECVQLLNTLHNHCINFYWIEGHAGYRGNEEADSVAKSTTFPINCTISENSINNQVFANIQPPLSLVKKKLRIMATIHTKRTINSSVSSNLLKRYLHNLLNHKSSKHIIKDLGVNSFRILSQVLSGHSVLHGHLSKFVEDIDPICPLCSIESESNYHFLCTCPALWKSRFIVFGHRILNLKLLFNFDLYDIAKFIRLSNRFREY